MEVHGGGSVRGSHRLGTDRKENNIKDLLNIGKHKGFQGRMFGPCFGCFILFKLKTKKDRGLWRWKERKQEIDQLRAST